MLDLQRDQPDLNRDLGLVIVGQLVRSLESLPIRLQLRYAFQIASSCPAYHVA